MSFLSMPTAGTPYVFSETCRGILGLFENRKVIENFQLILKDYLKAENLLLVNSGTTAFYVILKALKKLRTNKSRNEVILPAYTAPVLLLPIQALRLKPILVDVNPMTFNMDIEKAINAVTSRTLAVLPVHMFGIPCEVEQLCQALTPKKVFVIEDAASSLGSTLGNQHTGTISPIGFYSLNRGKNISTLTGGILVWKDGYLSQKFFNECKNLHALSPILLLSIALKIAGLSLAVRPIIYTFLNPFISQFKYTELHTHFESFRYTPPQVALGINLWKRIEELTASRANNGKALTKIFKNRDGYKLPAVPSGARVAFNQFPILMEDLNKRTLLQKRLREKGIETTSLYEYPLHHTFPELTESGKEPFPHATYLARHLFLIPPHAQIRRSILATIREVVESIG